MLNHKQRKWIVVLMKVKLKIMMIGFQDLLNQPKIHKKIIVNNPKQMENKKMVKKKNLKSNLRKKNHSMQQK